MFNEGPIIDDFPATIHKLQPQQMIDMFSELGTRQMNEVVADIRIPQWQDGTDTSSGNHLGVSDGSNSDSKSSGQGQAASDQASASASSASLAASAQSPDSHTGHVKPGLSEL